MSEIVETADGIRLWTRTAGSGPPIVVIHGGPGMSSGSLIGDLHPLERTRRLIYYDQRGGGRSSLPKDRSKLTIEANVSDLEAVREAFGLERVTLLAHSFGSTIAALYALEHPDRVERMVFLAPLPPRRGEFFEEFGREMNARVGQRMRRRCAELVAQIAAGRNVERSCREFWRIQTPPRLAKGASPSVLRSDLCDAPEAAIRYGMIETFERVFASMGDWDWTAELARVQAPALVIHGDEDAIPLGMVREWTAMPNARLLVLERTGHFPHAERPGRVFEAIETYLAGNWPAGVVS